MDTIGRKLFVNEDISVSATSPVIDLNNILHTGFHCVWTGTPTGTLYLEGSCQSEPTTWEEINSVAVAGAGDSQLWADKNTVLRWVRVRYASTGGAGTLNGNFIGKGDL